MNNEPEAPDLKPCPFCGGGETNIEPCGQTWMGQQYSEPQFYRLTHHGKLPEGDGFETCHIQFRARTTHDIVYMWNDTREDLPATNAQAFANEKVKALVDIAERVCARCESETESVTILDQAELRAALAAMEETD